MHIFIFNLLWMNWNAFLAATGVFLAWLIFKTKNRHLKLFLIPVWLAFVPNTIYIVTDIIHLPWQLSYVEGVMQIFILLQYLLFIPLGFITFYLSLRFFEQGIYPLYRKFSLSHSVQVEEIIVILNFLIAFGVVMGRFHRTNSWQIVTNIYRVLEDIGKVFTSRPQITAAILFGIFINFLYFFLKKAFLRNSR